MFFVLHEKRFTIFNRRIEKGVFFAEKFLISEYGCVSFSYSGLSESSESSKKNGELLTETRGEIDQLLFGLPKKMFDCYRELENLNPDFAEYLKLKLGEFNGRKLNEEEIRGALDWRPKTNNDAYFLSSECPHFKSSKFEKVILEILEVLKTQKDYKKIKILLAAAKHKLGNRSTEYVVESMRAKEISWQDAKKELAPCSKQFEKTTNEIFGKISSLLSVEKELSRN